jgi:hypothetical protein
MTTPERDTLFTHEDIRTQFLSRKLGGSAALAQALEMRDIYADTILSLDDDEHDKFIDSLAEEPPTEDSLFTAETIFEDRVKEAFVPIFGYSLDRVTSTSIVLERESILPADRPEILRDATRLIGEVQQDGRFTASKERNVLLTTHDRSTTRTARVSPKELMAIHIALDQLKEIDVMLDLEFN